MTSDLSFTVDMGSTLLAGERRKGVVLLERIFSSIHLHIAYMDREFNFIRVNRNYAAEEGREPEWFAGRNHFALYPHGENEAIFRRVVETGEPYFAYERPFTYAAQPHRATTWWDWSLQPVEGDDGSVAGVVLTLLDVSERVREREERRRTEEKLAKALDDVVQAAATATEMRDPYTAGHQRRVAGLAEAIARKLGLAEDEVKGVRMAAVVHDIGKVSIPAEILTRPGRLSPAEFDLVKTHCRVGHDILSHIDFPWPIATMILQHHEKMDGSGYPAGLRGDAILLGARIIAVADVVEAVASHRPYRPALGILNALEEVEAHQGSLFDPDVVRACVRLFREDGYQLL